jgi:hypothetical protein
MKMSYITLALRVRVQSTGDGVTSHENDSHSRRLQSLESKAEMEGSG